MTTTYSLILTILAAAILGLVPGCGPAATSKPKQPASGPEKLLDKFLTAVDTLDEAAIQSCFERSTEHGRRVSDLFVAAFQTLRAQRAFESAVRAKFGAAFTETRLGLGKDAPTRLLARVRALRGRTRLRPEGDVTKVEVLDGEGDMLPGFPGVMGKQGEEWTFGVAPQLPDDKNLCAALVDILGAFRDRYKEGEKAVSRSETTEAFLAAMKLVDDRVTEAAREAMVIVQPFLER